MSIIPISISQYNELVERISKLEQFEIESRTSQMLLFWVEAHDCNYIIAAPDIETALQVAYTNRKNNNVEYLGRAAIEYAKPQIVKWWHSYNWDKSEDDK